MRNARALLLATVGMALIVSACRSAQSEPSPSAATWEEVYAHDGTGKPLRPFARNDLRVLEDAAVAGADIKVVWKEHPDGSTHVAQAQHVGVSAGVTASFHTIRRPFPAWDTNPTTWLISTLGFWKAEGEEVSQEGPVSSARWFVRR